VVGFGSCSQDAQHSICSLTVATIFDPIPTPSRSFPAHRNAEWTFFCADHQSDVCSWTVNNHTQFLIESLTFPAGVYSMRCLSLALSLLLSTFAFAADGPKLAPPESDMKVIFNGKDLDGWDGDPKLWSVRDGVIHGETTAESPANGNTFLIWKKGSTKDFELRLSFRCNATNNSGIQYRSKHITDDKVKNAWVVRGYQHELRNEIKFPNTSSFIYDEGGKRGRICLVGEKASWGAEGKKVESSTLIDQAGFEKLMKIDDWNEVVIIGKGANVQHYLNNQLILDFTDNEPSLALREGVMAVQLHAGKPMWAEFKNVRIKEIK
jgi:hypothetical protein